MRHGPLARAPSNRGFTLQYIQTRTHDSILGSGIVATPTSSPNSISVHYFWLTNVRGLASEARHYMIQESDSIGQTRNEYI